MPHNVGKLFPRAVALSLASSLFFNNSPTFALRSTNTVQSAGLEELENAFLSPTAGLEEEAAIRQRIVEAIDRLPGGTSPKDVVTANRLARLAKVSKKVLTKYGYRELLQKNNRKREREGRPPIVLAQQGGRGGWRLDRSVGKPPWLAQTGREHGIDEFPISEAAKRKIRKEEASFVDRALVLARELGWSNEQLSLAIGRNEDLVRGWLKDGTTLPTYSTAVATFSALHAYPTILLTPGLSEKEVLRSGTFRDRLKLVLYSEPGGYEKVARAVGIDAHTLETFVSGTNRVSRGVIFEMAQATGREPVQLETGFLATKQLRTIPDEEIGFKRGRLTRQIRSYAEELEEELVRAWRRQGIPNAEVNRWSRQIAKDTRYGYQGLAARLYQAKQDSLEQAVYYGLIPRSAANQLLKQKPLTPHAVRLLADHLARAHEELEIFFKINPELRPPIGYGSVKGSRRIRYSWDLIARFLNRERLLVLLDAAPIDVRRFKVDIVLSKNPEKLIAEKETRLKELREAYSDFSKAALRYYVYYADPKGALDQARILRDRIDEGVRRGWIPPESPLGKHSPASFAAFTVSNGLNLAKSVDETFQLQDQTVRATLQDSSAQRLTELTNAMPLSPRGLNGETTRFLHPKGRDFLHRVLALLDQSDRKRFVQGSFDPREADRLVVTMKPLLQRVTTFLESKQGQLPRTKTQLGPFLKQVAQSLAGLEEVSFYDGFTRQDTGEIASGLEELVQEGLIQPGQHRAVVTLPAATDLGITRIFIHPELPWKDFGEVEEVKLPADATQAQVFLLDFQLRDTDLILLPLTVAAGAEEFWRPADSRTPIVVISATGLEESDSQVLAALARIAKNLKGQILRIGLEEWAEKVLSWKENLMSISY